MQIAVSGKFSSDQFDEAFDIAVKVREIVGQAGLDEIETEIDCLLFIPVIVSDELGLDKKSGRFYSRKDLSERVNIEIAVDDWVAADTRGKLKLMMMSLDAAVRETRSTRISEAAKELIIQRLQKAFILHSS